MIFFDENMIFYNIIFLCGDFSHVFQTRYPGKSILVDGGKATWFLLRRKIDFRKVSDNVLVILKFSTFSSMIQHLVKT